jgi:hypothetical protein
VQVLGAGGSSPVVGGGREVSINCRQPTSESTSFSPESLLVISTTPDSRVAPCVLAPTAESPNDTRIPYLGRDDTTASLMALSLTRDPCPAFVASRLPLEPNLTTS